MWTACPIPPPLPALPPLARCPPLCIGMTRVRIEGIMHWVHNTVGLPWWGTITALTLVVRVILVPINIALLRTWCHLACPRVASLQRGAHAADGLRGARG